MQPVLTRRGKLLTVVAVGIVAVAIAIAYASVEPSSGYYPRCAFKMLTGLSCPGCGSQRAIHALLQGDFRAAIGFNALFIAEIPLLLLLGFSWLFRDRFPRLGRVLSNQFFILVILATIIIWTIVRNSLFPAAHG